jgi:hypothetical protein
MQFWNWQRPIQFTGGIFIYKIRRLRRAAATRTSIQIP